MNSICFFGLAGMDYKGEVTNDALLLKKVVEALHERKINTVYLYKEIGNGLNDNELFKKFNIKSKRFSIDKYTLFTFSEFLKYTEEELNEIISFSQKLSLIKTGKDNTVNLLHSVFRYLENLKELDNKHQIDLFVFVGNSLISNTIRAYCKKNNKKYKNLEYGYFRPFTLMVDSVGVNYDSSIPRNIQFYEDIEVNQNRLDTYLFQPEKAIRDEQGVFNYRKMFYEHFGISINEKKEEVKSDNSINNHPDLPSEYIYVPFQLETDSQILKHSPNIKTMKELVEHTARALEEYNLINETNLKIIYKVHPLYKSESNIMDLKGIKQICEQNANLIFLTTGNNKQLIQKAKAVITVNSTVGFEALMAYKPVIILGEAFYGIKGISYVVDNLGNLGDVITKALTSQVNKESIEKFIYYLRFDYFVEIFRTNPDEASIDRLVKKLLEKSNFIIDII